MDSTLSIILDYGSPSTFNSTTYDSLLTDTFGNLSSLVAKAYPLSAFNSTPYPVYSAMVTVLTDQSFKCPAYRGLNVAQQKGIPSYTYLWAHTPSCPWYPNIPSEALPILGATHTSEIPFVFGALNNSPLPNGTCNFTSAEKSISAFMVAAWRSMAENGNPGPGWPQFGNTSLGINVVNSTSAGVVDYSSCAFFDKVNAMQLAEGEAARNGSSSLVNMTAYTAGTVPSRSLERAMYWIEVGALLVVASLL